MRSGRRSSQVRTGPGGQTRTIARKRVAPERDPNEQTGHYNPIGYITDRNELRNRRQTARNTQR